MGSLTDILSTGSGDSGSLSGGNITDMIAETVGDIVASALKSVLGNLS